LTSVVGFRSSGFDRAIPVEELVMTRCARLSVFLLVLAVSSYADAQPPTPERSTAQQPTPERSITQPPARERAIAGTVLITGSSRGLGLELATQYAAAGWRVIATARNPDGSAELRALAARDADVAIEKLDVLDADDLRALAAKLAGVPIDVLINNAGLIGSQRAQTLGSLDYEEFEELMAVNVYAPLAVADAFREHVAASAQKKIVSITSRSGIISQPGFGGPYFYRASKIALNMTMHALAVDLRQRGVIVALVSPPPTDTDMLRALIGPQNAARQARPADVVAGMIKVIDGLTVENSARPIYYDGTPLPW
jgi:NAD(P)-dependent dehydrogenase (short-subunit alcohol dehydrogenase family)